jgi:hypothetical protein
MRREEIENRRDRLDERVLETVQSSESRLGTCTAIRVGMEAYDAG